MPRPSGPPHDVEGTWGEFGQIPFGIRTPVAVAVPPFRVFLARYPKLQHIVSVSANGTVTAVCGRYWYPAKAPHRLGDVVTTADGYCRECAARVTGVHLRVESDDGRKIARLG